MKFANFLITVGVIAVIIFTSLAFFDNKVTPEVPYLTLACAGFLLASLGIFGTQIFWKKEVIVGPARIVAGICSLVLLICGFVYVPEFTLLATITGVAGSVFLSTAISGFLHRG
jgi:hypothetical protein